MKQNPIRLLGLTVLAGALFAQSASAFLVLSEQIVGYTTGTLGSAPTRGTLNGWDSTITSASITLTNGSGSLDGSLLNLVESEGDRVFQTAVPAGPTQRVRNQFAANNQFAPTNAVPPV